MDRIEYRNINNRVSWPSGPWDSEPDKVQWGDPATGYPCLIVRNTLGALCGYVGVTNNHPLFRQTDDNPVVEGLLVHGGITFTDFCQDDSDHHGICHIPAAGESDHIWWFGFDCAHIGDITPGYPALPSIRHHGEYRDIEYVSAQCAILALQLKAIADEAKSQGQAAA